VVDLGFPKRDAAAGYLIHSDWPRVFVAWEDFPSPDCLALFLFFDLGPWGTCTFAVFFGSGSLWATNPALSCHFRIEFVLLARVEGGIERDVKLGADQRGLPVQD
jgi:hypothetical protein